MKNQQETEITVLSEILRVNREEGYHDDDDFASRIATAYYTCLDKKEDLNWFLNRVSKIRTNFFKFNRIKKLDYLKKLFKKLEKKQIKIPDDKRHLQISIYDIFPKIKKINISDIDIDKILSTIYENVIQDELRKALKEKGGSPIPRRGKDSSLEVADIEQFYLDVRKQKFSFAVVVKGHKSLGGKKKSKKLNWEEVSYQVSRAHNRTKPDYVIFVSALEPVDGVISEMHLEGVARGNPHLIIFMTPEDLAKFLRWRKII